MKGINNMNEILEKIEDLRDFFKIGDEVIPFLGDMFLFFKDVILLISEARISLEDSTRKIPTASDRIMAASQATELATHEILDKLESISEKITKLYSDVSSENKSMIDEVHNDVTDIIYTLQFQDITAQKLDHANRILTAIYEKFIQLFDSIVKVKESIPMDSGVIEAIEAGVDHDALHKERKEFEAKTDDTIRQEEISQDDIDKLFL